MKSLYIIFLKKLLAFTILIAISGTIITQFIPENFITPTLPFLYVFFFAATLMVHYMLLKISEKRSPGFINFFMLVTFGKLIFFLTIILVYAFLYRNDAVQFILTFFILYVCFTAFEVTLTLSHNKHKTKAETNTEVEELK